MQKFVLLLVLLVCVCGLDIARGQENAAADQAGTAVSAVDPASTALTVNGVAITEAQISDAIAQQLAGRKNIPTEGPMLERYQQIMRPRVIDSMINVELISQAAKSENLSLTEDDIQNRLEDIVNIAMEQSGMTRDELAKDILKRQGMTIEESLAKYRENKQFLDTILLEKVAAAKYPQEITVSDDDVKKYYEENKEARYSKQEMVRASHILIKTIDEKGQPVSDEDKVAALETIKELKKKVDEPDSDFAEIARESSECPSGKRSGGDLNFFPRHNAMVEPFAKAAYDLKPGEVSDIVETQFGYHIIKCTDRQKAEVTPLEDVKDSIKNLLARNKKSSVLSNLTSELRKEAKIEYANPQDDPVVRAKIAEERKAAAQAAAESETANKAADENDE